ncbi:hypothetical protein MCUN1_000231 [Malassezia cuniculi]|uniref:Uncharacterized protein n=1 Tax=Malassezia cuniculi TaxID=948313 RepID=A0AAF0J4Q3_9BASI|nr:hypothetical protein MCUN1_000231 [Malassezia cuniculi]
MSYAGSLAHGEYADVEDMYDTHSEHDDFDHGSLSSFEIHECDEQITTVDELSNKLQQLRYSTPQISRASGASIRSHLLAEPHHRESESVPSCSYQRSCSTSCVNRLLRNKKGRLSELIAYGDDLPRSTSPPAHLQRQVASPEAPEWEIEMLPPAPAHNGVSPMDTIPPIRSPLSTCTNADGAVHTYKAISPELRALCEAQTHSRSSSTHSGRDPSSDTVRGSRSPRGRSHFSSTERLDGDTSDEALSKPSTTKQPARTALKRRTSRRCEKRGRQHSVRFCTSPPRELSTHNSEDYDRSACPPSNRLSSDDVEEMRDLKLGIGLLESKWALKHAQGDDERHTEDNFQRRLSTDIPTPNTSIPISVSPPILSPPVMPPPPIWRRNSDAQMGNNGALSSSPEMPRGRATSKLGSALAARFGLNDPPPPLPGMEHSLGTQSAPVSRGVSPMRGGFQPQGRGVSPPQRGISPSRTQSPQLEAVCESPVADLCESGSEYDFVG